MNHWTDISATARAAGWVLYPLSVLAIAALAITFDRAYALWRFARVPAAVEDDAAIAHTLPREHALRRLAPLLDDLAMPLAQLEARIEAVALRIERDMSRGLWLLETIVTAAPLVGLLGTIVGMMHAFRLIGDGFVNPSGVTGGVAQALIATAFGLVIALVALFAFNYFARRIDRLMDDVEIFANERLTARRVAAEPGVVAR